MFYAWNPFLPLSTKSIIAHFRIEAKVFGYILLLFGSCLRYCYRSLSTTSSLDATQNVKHVLRPSHRIVHITSLSYSVAVAILFSQHAAESIDEFDGVAADPKSKNETNNSRANFAHTHIPCRYKLHINTHTIFLAHKFRQILHSTKALPSQFPSHFQSILRSKVHLLRPSLRHIFALQNFRLYFRLNSNNCGYFRSN